LNPLVVLDGTGEHSRGNQWESSSHVTIEQVEPAPPTPVVEDMTPNPSLLDDGDVEPNPGPINLAQFGEQPTEQIAWIQWFKHHCGPIRDGPDGWITQYYLKFTDTTQNNIV
jgi:hypothetical protein